VDVFTFDRAEHEVTHHGSTGVQATRIAQFAGMAHATCLAVAPGGVVGTHPAVGACHVLLIVSGSAGWPEATGSALPSQPGRPHTGRPVRPTPLAATSD